MIKLMNKCTNHFLWEEIYKIVKQPANLLKIKIETKGRQALIYMLIYIL